MDFHSFFEVKKLFSRGDRHVLTVLSNFQSDVVFREFSIGNPIVRLKKDFLGSGAQNRAVTPGENSTPELFCGKSFCNIMKYPQLRTNLLKTLWRP